MVSPFGRGFDSLQLHESAPNRGLFRGLEGVEPSSNGETGAWIGPGPNPFFYFANAKALTP